jgi:DNA polymerase-1
MRAAVNMPFQGSAADIMKLAMIKVEKVLQAYSTKQGVGSRKKGESRFLTSNSSLLTPAGEARILLQIHDSLIVECPEDQAKSIAKLLKDTMENVHRLPVKLTVDTSIGKNWGEL